MTTCTAPAPRLAVEDVVDVLGLDDEAVLASVVAHRAAVRRAEVAELRAVAAWADRHRISDPEQWTCSAQGSETVEDLTAHPDRAAALLEHQPGELGVEGVLRLAGEGAFMVREFAITDLAVALELAEPTARAYVAQAVELRDRLPRLWGQVMAGRLPVWKARRIAEQTIPLGRAAAGFVDDQLAEFAHRLSLGRILRCVEAAIIRFHPDQAARRAEAAAQTRGVWVEDHAWDGTTTVTATVDSPDAHAFDLALDHTAGVLGALGDASSRQVRRARAVGVLADPQYALDLTAAATASPVDAQPKLRRTAAWPVIHLHLHTVCGCDSTASGEVPAPAPFGPVTRTSTEGLHSWRPGPVPTAAVRRWLEGLTPGARVSITPVVDLAARIAVDAYEHPVAVARQVAKRDHTCQFPWCGRAGATYDLDHIEPYVPPDDGGPPGQTSTANTARLCRYHHRVKTQGHWHYRRTGPTELTWTSPQHRTYTVDHTGTRADR